MTGKQSFINALERKAPQSGHVPHFELVFFLTMEAFGKIHPQHRNFEQWNQMSLKEKNLWLNDIADCYIKIAQKYNHSAIFVQPCPGDFESLARIFEIIREKTGDEYFTMTHGDPTFAIPDGDTMMDFSAMLYDEPEKAHDIAKRNLENALIFAEKMNTHNKGLLDGFALCSDYCFNTNPFFGPELYDEFIDPYLKGVISEYKKMDYYSIKHTDGNIMPILERLANSGAHALHSLDPQGGVDLAKVKRLVGNKVCLIGNVNCGLLQTGSIEECSADVRRSLNEGMPGGGYIFSTSNCVYTGLALERYELMHKIWREEGIYS